MRKPRLDIRHMALAALLLLAAGPALAAPVKLPPVTKATLGNGLQVYVMPTHRLPLVAFRLVARAGSVDDPAGKEGLALLTAALLTQGAGRRDAQQIAEDIAFVGGTLGAYAANEQLVVTCKVLTKDFDTGLELFRDVIVSPAFAAAEFGRKQDETLGDLAAMKDQPAQVANSELAAFLLGGSPLGHPTQGWTRSVSAITREDVAGFHRRFIVPDRAMLAVVGDVDPRRVVAALERAFAGWKPSGQKSGGAYTAPARDGRREVLVVSKPEVTQTQFRLACIGVPRNDPDYYAILLANTALGGGFTSRLVNEIRVNLGLTYTIRSRFTTFRHAGVFAISSFTKNATLRKAIDATLGEVRKLVDQGPTEAELAKVKRFLTGQFPLGLQAPDDLAAQVLDAAFYGLEPDYVERFAERINAVTMADAKRVLKKHFCVDDLKILVVSNPETARQALEGLGPIRVKEMD